MTEKDRDTNYDRNNHKTDGSIRTHKSIIAMTPKDFSSFPNFAGQIQGISNKTK